YVTTPIDTTPQTISMSIVGSASGGITSAPRLTLALTDGQVASPTNLMGCYIEHLVGGGTVNLIAGTAAAPIAREPTNIQTTSNVSISSPYVFGCDFTQN